MFFKHKYITQPAVTVTDTIVQALADLYQVLNGLPPVKGDIRTAVELLMDIFKTFRSKEETETDAQQKWSAKAADERKNSN